jgi:hypothetical protein
MNSIERFNRKEHSTVASIATYSGQGGVGVKLNEVERRWETLYEYYQNAV